MTLSAAIVYQQLGVAHIWKGSIKTTAIGFVEIIICSKKFDNADPDFSLICD